MEEKVFLDANNSIFIAKYKRRKVSARRDFPKGCGLKVAQINLKSLNDSSATNTPKGEINLDSRGVVTRDADSSPSILCIPTVYKVPPEPKLMTISNFLEKTLCPKFPPRRRISAIRRFPINFKRNVLEFTKDEHVKSQASSVCTRSIHAGAENNDVKSNQAMKINSLEGKDILKAESKVSRKSDCLFTLNSDENLQGECQASNVKESNCMLGSCSIGTSKGFKIHSRVTTSESGNQNMASNMVLVDCDFENDNSDRIIGNVVPSENAVHCEEKGFILISESSNSNETTLDEVNVIASRTARTSIEIIEDCSRIEFPSKNSRNNVVIYALMAAQNCPERNNKVVNLRVPHGKKKNDAKQFFDKKRDSTSLSKRRRVSTTLKASDPYVTVVDLEDDEKSSCDKDEECDGDNASFITRYVNIAPIVSRDTVTHDDSDKCISHSEVRESSCRYSSVSSKLQHKEQATGGGGQKHQEGEKKTCEQNRRPVPVQPELASKSDVTKKSKRSNIRHGVCLHDISDGAEPIPIRAINSIDDQQPPSFKYVTRMVYPDWCRPIPLRGCNCVGGCSDSPGCACAVSNGGEIPFNGHGRIVELKPLIYECGPSCKCPPSCPNRVGQLGIRYLLEIFKTESRGWGVRSRNHIPIGGFICEYIGELLEDKQAEQRIGSDEYLFDIGSNNSDQEDMEVVNRFTIDAKRCGNVGRFINHSCSPNLCAQDVLFDHEDKRIPHVMFFAVEDIPPLQELTYDYNYHIGEVSDQNGNVKVKQCFCGSKECNGRLY